MHSLRFCPSELDEGGNEVWDDLGFDPTEAKRRKGNRAENVSRFSYNY